MDATTVAWIPQRPGFELAIANAQWRVVWRQRLNRKQFTRLLAETPATHVVARGMALYWGRVAQKSRTWYSQAARRSAKGATTTTSNFAAVTSAAWLGEAEAPL